MSPRGEEDNRKIREQQRSRIAAAATSVFARKGFAATRISDIAQAAKVSQGLVHHYFESKDALFSELVRDVMTSATSVPELAAQQPGTPMDRLRWYVQVVLAGMVAQPDAVMLSWQAQGAESVPTEVMRVVQKSGKAALRRVTELVAAAQASGEARQADPELLAAHLVAFLQGLALQAAYGPVPKGFPDVELVMAVLRGGRR